VARPSIRIGTDFMRRPSEVPYPGPVDSQCLLVTIAACQ
jgi:hypothetical protein